MSYVIRNCPATYQNFEDKFVCTSQIKVKSFPFYCQNCTDCLLKQIANKCMERYVGFLEESFIKDEILNLLQIEVIE